MQYSYVVAVARVSFCKKKSMLRATEKQTLLGKQIRPYVLETHSLDCLRPHVGHFFKNISRLIVPLGIGEDADLDVLPREKPRKPEQTGANKNQGQLKAPEA